MYAQLAKIALDVMGKALIPADDNSPRAIATARQMLHDIVAGKLVVGTPVPEHTAEQPQIPGKKST
jgi:uncharacterized RDD family membrane protein YckC